MSEQLKINLYNTAVTLASRDYTVENGYAERYEVAMTPENIKKIYDRLVELFSEEVKSS